MGNTKGNKNIFGNNAPSRNLAFPLTANFTACEIQCFFPNASVKNAHVIHRYGSNGALPKPLAIMTNFYRTFPEHPKAGNSILKTMQETMVTSGYQGWNFGTHKTIFPGPWVDNLTAVDGFAVEAQDIPGRAQNKDGVVTDMPFIDLMRDVRTTPQKFDRLDLTGAVEYACARPNMDYRYPRDYDELVRLSGGPHEVTIEHCDKAVFSRWSKVKAFHSKKYIPPPGKQAPKQATTQTAKERRTRKLVRRNQQVQKASVVEQPREESDWAEDVTVVSSDDEDTDDEMDVDGQEVQSNDGGGITGELENYVPPPWAPAYDHPPQP